MLSKLLQSLTASNDDGLARTFSRLGRTGFWAQVVMGSFTVVLMIYFFIFANSPTGPRAGLPVVEYLALVNIAVLVFTTFWFHRYTRIAGQIADPQLRPSRMSLTKTVWTGLIASTIGLVFSILVIFIESAHLLFYFLATPQGGIPVIQTPVGGSISFVSAVDMLSLMSLILTLAAEIVAMILGLWLLFRTAQPAATVQAAE